MSENKVWDISAMPKEQQRQFVCKLIDELIDARVKKIVAEYEAKLKAAMLDEELIKELKLLKSYFEDRRIVELHINDICWEAIDKAIIAHQQKKINESEVKQ